MARGGDERRESGKLVAILENGLDAPDVRTAINEHIPSWSVGLNRV
jgi:hypothetical protein